MRGLLTYSAIKWVYMICSNQTVKFYFCAGNKKFLQIFCAGNKKFLQIFCAKAGWKPP